MPRFWELARRVGAEARRHGLAVPGFRSPPRLPGAVRTVCRQPGGALVAVAWRGRSPADVVGDLVDGLVLVNGLAGPEAAACRRSLRAALAQPAAGASAGPGSAPDRPAPDRAAPARAGGADLALAG